MAVVSDGSILVLDCPMGRVQRFEGRGKGSVLVPPPKSMPAGAHMSSLSPVSAEAKSLAVPEAIKQPGEENHRSQVLRGSFQVLVSELALQSPKEPLSSCFS